MSYRSPRIYNQPCNRWHNTKYPWPEDNLFSWGGGGDRGVGVRLIPPVGDVLPTASVKVIIGSQHNPGWKGPWGPQKRISSEINPCYSWLEKVRTWKPPMTEPAQPLWATCSASGLSSWGTSYFICPVWTSLVSVYDHRLAPSCQAPLWRSHLPHLSDLPVGVGRRVLDPSKDFSLHQLSQAGQANVKQQRSVYCDHSRFPFYSNSWTLLIKVSRFLSQGYK